MSSGVEFRVLGPLDIRDARGVSVRLGAPKHRTLLAVLLLSANHTVTGDALADAVWPRRPPRSAASVLRTYVSAVRKALGLDASGGATRLEAHGGGYRLCVPPGDLDLLVFAELAAAGRRALAGGDPPEAVAALQRALALWHGRPLEDVPLDYQYESELVRLEDARLAAVEALGEARLALGRHAEVLAELAPHVTAQPMRETLHAHWMLALYRAGRQAEALRVYRELRERLVDQLGIEPGPPLQRLHRQILAGDPALDPPAPAAGEPAPAGWIPQAPRQLPPVAGIFTGRAAPLARLRRLLTEPSPAVCVIDGIGGVGKSTLAVHAAYQVADRFPDGQLYADLNGTGAAVPPPPPLAVLNRFLRDLGVRTRDTATLDEASAAFRTVTTDRRMLVLLDNARDAAQVAPLLPAGAGCRVLVTSRQLLTTLDNAVHVHLDLLGPAESVALLGRLAGRDRVGADPAAAAEVARLCGHLPLALRVAGARLAARLSWPVRSLAERLADAGSRLDELRAGHLGVRACLRATLDALRDGDRQDRAAAAAFPLLSLPDGGDLATEPAARLLGWPRRDAEAALERLVEVRLVEAASADRYRMHELLCLLGREEAQSRHAPAERAAALTRLLGWYAAAAVAGARLLRPGDRHPAPAGGWAGPPGEEPRFADARQALDRLAAERGAIVAAIAQCAALPDVPASLVVGSARALSAYFLSRGGWRDWTAVSRAALAAARRVGDRRGQAYADRDLGIAYERLCDYRRAEEHLTAALAAFSSLGERHGAASCLTSLGIVHHRQGRYAEAMACHRRALAFARQVGNGRTEAECLRELDEDGPALPR